MGSSPLNSVKVVSKWVFCTKRKKILQLQMMQVCHITFRKEILAAPQIKALYLFQMVWKDGSSASLEISVGPSRVQSKNLFYLFFILPDLFFFQRERKN